MIYTIHVRSVDAEATHATIEAHGIAEVEQYGYDPKTRVMSLIVVSAHQSIGQLYRDLGHQGIHKAIGFTPLLPETK